MLEAAISVATEENKTKLRAKDAEMRALKKEAGTREKALQEEKDRVSQELTQKVQELERSAAIHEKDRGALERRNRAIMKSAARRANLIVGALQAASGIVILLLAGSVLASLIVEEPPGYVKVGAGVFAVLSLAMTILALDGRGFIGLNTIEGRLAARLFLRRCEALGIDEREALAFIDVRHGRLTLKAREAAFEA